ncbi:MAG: ABC transporter ATP-binding protein [Leptolyngbya sp. SIO4C1]|nr:ABC transporter ATP-binding protein [Leptolyngbya sp. SIO4C1]
MSQSVSSKPHAAQAALAAPDVELRNVSKVFAGELAVQGINLEIRQGEFFSILGPSGCGKTTTLRMIAGFETPSTGELLIQNQDMQQVPPHRRSVNTVFQSYALFDHMSVWDNIAFGLRVKRQARSDIRQRVGEALQLVQMETLAKRYPSQLSGGQKQRVALARAIVNRPAVMLLDEPLGALDLKLRKQMQVELSNLHRRLGITFIMVTHDQEEALSLSDRIAVMRAGQIEQVGSPSEIYEQPNTAFVADFIGETNLLSGKAERLSTSKICLFTHSGLRIVAQQSVAQPPAAIAAEAYPADISVRPEKLVLSAEAPAVADNCFEGRVCHMMYLGTHVHCMVELTTGDRLTVLQSNQTPYKPNPDMPVFVSWQAADCRALLAEHPTESP